MMIWGSTDPHNLANAPSPGGRLHLNLTIDKFIDIIFIIINSFWDYPSIAFEIVTMATCLWPLFPGNGVASLGQLGEGQSDSLLVHILQGLSVIHKSIPPGPTAVCSRLPGVQRNLKDVNFDYCLPRLGKSNNMS